jgi:hypothetical protein
LAVVVTGLAEVFELFGRRVDRSEVTCEIGDVVSLSGQLVQGLAVRQCYLDDRDGPEARTSGGDIRRISQRVTARAKKDSYQYQAGFECLSHLHCPAFLPFVLSPENVGFYQIFHRAWIKAAVFSMGKPGRG